MLELVLALRPSGISFDIECFCSYEIEGTFVLRKGSREGVDYAESSLRQAKVELPQLVQSMKDSGSNLA